MADLVRSGEVRRCYGGGMARKRGFGAPASHEEGSGGDGWDGGWLWQLGHVRVKHGGAFERLRRGLVGEIRWEPALLL